MERKRKRPPAKDEEKASTSTGRAGSKRRRSNSSSLGEEPPPKKEVPGTGLEGHMYEVKLLALWFFRLIHSVDIKDFSFDKHVEVFRPLDDVVLSYTTIAEPNTVKTIFIQLKHKDKKTITKSMFTTPGEVFYLKPYLIAIDKIKEMSDGTRERPEIFEGSFEHCEFVIYTSAPEGKTLAKCKRKNDTNEIDALLKTGSETDVERKERIFNFDEQNKSDKKIYKLPANENEKEYLDKIRVFAGQALEGDLDEMTRSEMADRLGKTSTETVRIYDSYLKAILDWWKNSNDILNKTSNILQICVDDCFLSKYNLVQKNMGSINFKSENFFTMDDLDRYTFLHIVTSCRSALLSTTKYVQSLRGVKEDFPSLSLDDLLEETEPVLSAWIRGSKDRLLIVSESTDKHEIVCNTIKEHFQNLTHNRKKLIIVSTEKDQFVLTLKETLLRNKIACEAIMDTFHLDQLEPECKKKIVGRDTIFQGKPTKLGEILGEEAKIDGDVVNHELVRCALLPSSSMTIGAPLEEDLTYYVTRNLERHDILNGNVLKYTKDAFIVHGITKEELKVMTPSGEKVSDVGADDECRFLVVESDDDVRYIDKVLARKENVHEVKFVGGCLRWIATKGTNELKNEFIKHDCPAEYNPVTDRDLDARVILLIAEPGMGKTIFVTHLALETKASYHYFWVIRVNLGQHKTLLEKKSNDAVGFLSAALGIDQSEAALFRFVIETAGNCVVFFDGFDEIAPEYTEKGLSLVSSVLKTKVKKICITSRHSMKETLESTFSTRAFSLKKFNETDQEMFFVKYWNRDGNLIVSDQTTQLIQDLIRLIVRSLNDAEKEFMGIPLQTMMLAEMYKDKQNAAVAELAEELNVLTMFENFIIGKFKIYLIKQFGYNKVTEKVKKILLESICKEHMYASLEFLLSKDQINSLYKGTEIVDTNKIFYNEFKSGDCTAGIIIEVLSDTPVFLHRTFAEYFAARWFAIHFTERENPDILREFLRDNLFSVEFNFIRRLFNLMLAKESKLLTAVINNDIESVRSLLTSSGDDSDIKVKDLGGRSVLHLVAVDEHTWFRSYDRGGWGQYYEPIHSPSRPPCSTSMVQLLLEKGADSFTVDNVMGWIPLVYAAKTDSWHALEHLCSKSTAEDNVTVLQGHLTNKLVVSQSRGFIGEEVKRTLIHAASAHGYVNVVSVLGRMFPDSIWARGHWGTTPLQEASKWNEIEVARVLIELFEKVINKRGALDESRSDPTGQESPGKILSIADEDTSEPNYNRASHDIYGARPMSLFEYTNMSNAVSFSAVHFAAGHGQSELLRLLISKEGNIWAVDGEGQIPLHRACRLESESAARVLINSLGDSTEKIRKYVYTKCKELHPTLLNALISKGVDFRIMDNAGNTPLHFACFWGNEDIVQVLIGVLGDNKELVANYINMQNPMRDKATALQFASCGGHGSLIRYLVSKGGDVWARGMRGGTLLHDACKRGDVEMARFLIDSLPGNTKTSEYVNKGSDSGETAVHLASHAGHLDVVKLLVSKGADVRITDTAENTLLHLACVEGNEGIAQALIGGIEDDEELIANYINMQTTRRISYVWLWDIDPGSALEWASWRGHGSLVRYLVSKGGEVWARGKRGGTLLHDACERGDVETVRALVDLLRDKSDVRVSYVNTVNSDGRMARDMVALKNTKGEFNNTEDVRTKVVEYLDKLI